MTIEERRIRPRRVTVPDAPYRLLHLVALSIAGLVLAQSPPAAHADLLNLDVSGVWESYCFTGQNLCVPCSEVPEVVRPSRTARLDIRVTDTFVDESRILPGVPVLVSTVVGQARLAVSCVQFGTLVPGSTSLCDVFNPKPDIRSNMVYTPYDIEGRIEWHTLRVGSTDVTSEIRLQGTYAGGPGFPHRCAVFEIVDTLSSGHIGFPKDDPSIPPREMRFSLVLNQGTYLQESPKCYAGTQILGDCWHQTSGRADLLTQGDIAGRVISGVQTLTDPEEPERQVHRATVRLYQQNGGRLREQGQEESDFEYLEFVTAQDRTFIKEFVVRRNEDGSFGPDGPGWFEFRGVPAFRFTNDGGRTGTVFYTLEVAQAETDEVAVDEFGDPIPDKFTTLHFSRAAQPNVVPMDDPSPIEIVAPAITGIERKQQIADRLREVCPVHYGPIEDDADVYLEALRSLGTTLPADVEEGLHRAVWAQYIVLHAALNTEEALTIGLGAMGTLVSDIYEKIANLVKTDTLRARNAAAIRDGTPAPGFGTAAAPNAQALAELAHSPTLLREAEIKFLERLNGMLDVYKPKLAERLFQLAEGKLTQGQATSITETIVAGIKTVLVKLQTDSNRAARSVLIRQFIKEAFRQSVPLFMDEFAGVSFCAQTSDSLARAVARMQTWSDADGAVYREDRDQVVKLINAINSISAEVVTRVYAEAELAKAFGKAKDVFSLSVLLGDFDDRLTANPHLEAAAKVSELSKFFLNFLSTAEALGFGLGVLPYFVDESVSVILPPAEADAPSAALEGQPQGLPFDATISGVAPSAAATSSVLAEIDGTLREDEIGLFLQLVYEGEDSYGSERARWRKANDAYLRQAGAVDPASWTTTRGQMLDQAVAARDQLSVVEADLDALMADLVLRVMTGDYRGPDDPAYIVDRDGVLVALSSARTKLNVAAAASSAVGGHFSGLAATPVLAVETVSLESTATQSPMIGMSPETFVLRMRAANVSNVAVNGVAMQLAVGSPEGSILVSEPLQRMVGGGTLGPTDGLGNGGSDEAEVEWTLTYNGALGDEQIVLAVEVSASDVSDPAALGTTTHALLTVEPVVADGDLDGMPDVFENLHGLDPEVDDSKLDPDVDGLTNFGERILDTNPKSSDSDGDGLSDGDELAGIPSGFATDPLEPDSDGDGVADGLDGSPTDASTSAPAENPEEPAVSVESNLVLLTSSEAIASLTVTNSGSGTLLWSVVSEHPAMLDVIPQGDKALGDGDALVLQAPADLDLASIRAAVTRLVVIDVAGTRKDAQEVTVVLGDDVASAVCGHGNTASIGSNLTASDALSILRAAVGLVACEPCRCDVDDSGGTKSSDALATLRAAVGQPVPLTCPAC